MRHSEPDPSIQIRREAALAWACDHANCTPAQAGALRLLFRGKRVSEIRRRMGLSFTAAQNALDRGRERLEEAFQHVIRERVEEIRQVLDCVRNHQDCRPAPVLTFAKVPGGYDPVPVTVRAKPHGSVAEDLIEDNSDFLRVLVDFVS